MHTAKIWSSSWIWAVYNSSPFQKRFGTRDNVKRIWIVKEVKVLDCGCQKSQSKHSSTPICQPVNHSYADDKRALVHKRARGQKAIDPRWVDGGGVSLREYLLGTTSLRPFFGRWIVYREHALAI